MECTLVFFLLICLFVSPNLANSKDLFLLSSDQYKNLSQQKQTLYVQSLRLSWFKFEKQYRIYESKPTSFYNWFIPLAHAQGQKCIVGGRVQEAVKNERGNLVCPTTTHACEYSPENPDGFLCGEIYASQCIPRNPIPTLSDRCYKEGRNHALSVEQFKKLQTALQKDFESLCESGPVHPNTQDGCKSLRQSLEDGAHQALGLSVSNLDSSPTRSLGTPSTTASPSSNAKLTPFVDDPNCPNSENPKQPLFVPMFSFKEHRQCLFQRNKEQLDKIKTLDCTKDSKPSANLLLFSTRLEYTENFPQKPFENFIITGMKTLTTPNPETTGGRQDFTYSITALVPEIQGGVAKLTPKEFLIKRVLRKTVSCKASPCASGTCGEEGFCEELFIKDTSNPLENTPYKSIKISNQNRRNILPGKFHGTRDEFQQFMDKRVLLSSDCKLQGAIEELTVPPILRRPDPQRSGSGVQ